MFKSKTTFPFYILTGINSSFSFFTWVSSQLATTYDRDSPLRPCFVASRSCYIQIFLIALDLVTSQRLRTCQREKVILMDWDFWLWVPKLAKKWFRNLWLYWCLCSEWPYLDLSSGLDQLLYRKFMKSDQNFLYPMRSLCKAAALSWTPCGWITLLS